MFVTNWISTTKIQKISEITNFFRHYFYPELRSFFSLLDKIEPKWTNLLSKVFRNFAADNKIQDKDKDSIIMTIRRSRT